jgi:hypothetical protein
MSQKCQTRTSACLFDHLIGAREHGCRHFEAKGLRGLEINHELVLGRRLHRQIGRLLALKDAVDVAGRAPVLLDPLGVIGDQSKRPSSVRFPTSTYGIVLDQEITDCGTGTQASVAERPVQLPPVTREQHHANHPIL